MGNNIRPIIYTAQSKNVYYAKMLICRFVITKGSVPLNPFNAFGYFLDDLVERDEVRICNSNLIRIADELWSFGPISDGVLMEIEYAMRLNKPLKFFSVGSEYKEIKNLSINNITLECNVLLKYTEIQIKSKIAAYVADKSSTVK